MRPWNEDVAWQRLQDVQREAENRRLTYGDGLRSSPWKRLLATVGRRLDGGRGESAGVNPASSPRRHRGLLARCARAMEDVIWILNRGAHGRWWSS